MPEITITDTHQRRAKDRILDVREGFEVTDGMIPKAIHIPMGELSNRLNEIDRARAQSSWSAAAVTEAPALPTH